MQLANKNIEIQKSIFDEKYELTIFLSPFVFKNLDICKFMNGRLLNNTKRRVLLCCTSDSIWWNYWDDLNDRSPHYGFLKDLDFSPPKYANQRYLNYNKKFAAIMDDIICLAPDYVILYENAGFRVKKSSFPININPIRKKYGSRFIYHGITRAGFKGSKVILKHLKKHYSQSEIKITHKISSEEFISELNTSKIYFDQVFSQTPAMAALLAMQYCPLVVTGVNRDLKTPYVIECPALDFKTEALDEILFGELSKIQELDLMSRNYELLKQFHCADKVTREIING